MTCSTLNVYFEATRFHLAISATFQNYLHRHKIIMRLIGTYRTMLVVNPLLNPYSWLKVVWIRMISEKYERLADCITDHCIIMGFFESIILSLEEGRWGRGSLQTKLWSSMLSKSTFWPCFFVFWVTEGTNLVTQKGRSRYNNTLQLHHITPVSSNALQLERNGGW